MNINHPLHKIELIAVHSLLYTRFLPNHLAVTSVQPNYFVISSTKRNSINERHLSRFSNYDKLSYRHQTSPSTTFVAPLVTRRRCCWRSRLAGRSARSSGLVYIHFVRALTQASPLVASDCCGLVQNVGAYRGRRPLNAG